MSTIFHTMWAAMKFSDSEDDFNFDLGNAFAKRPHSLGCSAVAPGAGRPLLIEAAKAHDYVVYGGPGDTALAIRGDLEVSAHGYLGVLDSRGGPDRHSKRGIDWVKFRLPDGTTVFDHCAHWLTDHEDHLKMSRAMIDNVQTHGAGDRIAFWKGDLNDRQTGPETRYDRVFTEAGLTTIYSEVGFHGPTHGNEVIDVIGSYDKDRRVRGRAIKRWPKGRSDHYRISAYYDIAGPR